MTVEPLVPDLAAPRAPRAIPLPQSDDASPAGDDLTNEFSQALGALSTQFDKAQSAQQQFVNGTGSLQSMVFERAQADALLEIATAASSRVSQQLNSILNMQV